jgi:hypothetical protein
MIIKNNIHLFQGLICSAPFCSVLFLLKKDAAAAVPNWV